MEFSQVTVTLDYIQLYSLILVSCVNVRLKNRTQPNTRKSEKKSDPTRLNPTHGLTQPMTISGSSNAVIHATEMPQWTLQKLGRNTEKLAASCAGHVIIWWDFPWFGFDFRETMYRFPAFLLLRNFSLSADHWNWPTTQPCYFYSVVLACMHRLELQPYLCIKWSAGILSKRALQIIYVDQIKGMSYFAHWLIWNP